MIRQKVNIFQMLTYWIYLMSASKASERPAAVSSVAAVAAALFSGAAQSCRAEKRY